MAKCDLSIELDDPNAVYPGGGMIGGVIRVRADQNVHCNGLEVQTVWRTHGRGNVASGIAHTVSLFSGQWNAGEQTEYRFELPVASWPPTYHGHYMNIDHYVDARAKIPWSFDPKASTPFRMRPTEVPDDARTATKTVQVPAAVGAAIAMSVAVAIMMVGIIMAKTAGLFVLFFFIGAPLIGGTFWLIRYFLPKYRLGEVTCHLDPEKVEPGQQVQGELVITPKKNVPINGIKLEFQAREQVVSGSGSNRTTHRHVFFEKTAALQGAMTLAAQKEHRFPLSVTLPDDAPYSIDLDDNDLIWSTTLRVDIPRWPDWVKELPLMVLPSGKREPPTGHVVPPSEPAVAADDGASGITFDETARHLWSLRNDRDQTEKLVDAVSGLTFDLQAQIERRLLYAGDDDPHVYEGGYAVWARYSGPELPLVMYVPHELADEFEQTGRDVWRGRGTIVGWDVRHGRLQIKVERP